MKINCISQEFSLKSQHCNKSPFKPKEYKSSLKLFKDLKNGYNNESPDFFRVDSMRENNFSYRNPHLNEVISDKRNSFYNDLRQTQEQIKYIENLKTNRELSQNPNVNKFITGNELELYGKQKRTHYMSNKNIKITLDTENEKMKHFKSEYSPKLNYSLKHKILKENNRSQPSISLEFDPKKSSYLKNNNDYNIRENTLDNCDKFLTFEKKEVDMYNCITNTKIKIKPEKFKGHKWGSFYEK